jgi:lysophospholipase L1-like esterase
MISKPSAIMIVAVSSVVFLLMLTNMLAARKEKDGNSATATILTGGLEDFIISCVGDSITNGSSVNFSSSYPAILRRHFERKSVEVHNFGSNGQTVLKVSDHSYWLEEEYRRAMLTQANHVIIQFGTNDAKPPNWNEDLFRLDYTNLIERFQLMPSLPVVFICIPPPIYCPKRTNENEKTNTCWKYNERSQITNNLLQHVIPDIAFRTGASLISNFKLLGGDKLLKPEAFFEPGKLKEEEWTNIAPYDGIHPNEIGNELMAANIATKIVEHNHRSARLIRNYNHHKVIENADQVHNSQVIASTSSIRSEVKHEAVYSHIYNHTMNNPNMEGTNPIMRPVIACVGVSEAPSPVQYCCQLTERHLFAVKRFYFVVHLICLG